MSLVCLKAKEFERVMLEIEVHEKCWNTLKLLSSTFFLLFLLNVRASNHELLNRKAAGVAIGFERV